MAAGLVAALYHQLFVARDASELWQAARSTLSEASLWPLIVVMALVPLNLLLEAHKFRLLLAASGSTHRIGLFLSLQRVLAGLTVGFMTPNRVGEYAGRLAGAREGEKAATVFATLIGGLAQWIPILLGGVAAAFVFPLLPHQLNVAVSPGLGILLIFVGAGIYIGYIKLPQLVRFAHKLLARMGLRQARLQGFLQRLEHSLQHSSRVLNLTLLIAVCRYGVYVMQLALAFHWVGVDVDFWLLLAGTALVYFAQSFLPLPAAVQALARTELAILLFASAEPNPLGVALASLLIFVLNLALPALVGLGIILRTDVDQTLGFAKS